MRRSWTPSLLLLTTLALGVSRADDGDGFIHVLGDDGKTAARPLHLVAEKRLESLLEDDHKRFEASGVVARGNSLYVVFDDTPDVARVRADLSDAEWIETDGEGPGYEGIAWSPETERFFCVIESAEHDGDRYGRVATYDSSFSLLDEAWLRVPLSSDNKGFEGVAVVEREGKTYLLALHEGHADDARDDGLGVDPLAGARHLDREKHRLADDDSGITGEQQPVGREVERLLADEPKAVLGDGLAARTHGTTNGGSVRRPELDRIHREPPSVSARPPRYRVCREPT